MSESVSKTGMIQLTLLNPEGMHIFKEPDAWIEAILCSTGRCVPWLRGIFSVLDTRITSLARISIEKDTYVRRYFGPQLSQQIWKKIWLSMNRNIWGKSWQNVRYGEANHPQIKTVTHIQFSGNIIWEWIKETRVGNGFFKSEKLFIPEQPNLEDEISLRGGRFVTPWILPFSFSDDFLGFINLICFSMAMWF